MLTSAVLTLAFAATGFAQLMPEGYRNVYITSMVDTKFIVVPVAPVKNGTKLVVYVQPFRKITEKYTDISQPDQHQQARANMVY